MSRQTQVTQFDRQTALQHSTTIDVYDMSTDQDESVFRDTVTSPDTSFLPSSASYNIAPKPSNRFRNNRQRLQDYINGNRRWPCGVTNFHFTLCLGMVGFTVFWTGLLLRIYLPSEYFS